ncbi:hypothetical protein FACS1894111_07860 [Clostridia bacterium]|nr:hypothetical protein FACS1894111_07860 [Clostridia bacterium]
MESNPGLTYLNEILYHRPYAYACMNGSAAYPDLYGMVRFYQAEGGTLLNVEIYDLPVSPWPCGANVYGFHIHEGNACTGNATDAFADAKGHYNPTNCEHPAHAGDLPPLFADNGGFAWYNFFAGRFSCSEIVGRTVIIHHMSDDFKTQPSGDSGEKIGCGVIIKTA